MSKGLKHNIGEIFLCASNNMKNDTASKSWDNAISASNTSMNKEDLDVLKGLRKITWKNRFARSVKSN